MGFYVGRGGYLSREDENGEDGKKNGKKNGNGNGGNGNGGNGNGGSNGGSNGGGNGGGGNGGMSEESNPRIPRKKGQPANSKKHSDLYTDENPKGTIHGLGFKDVETAKASVSKIRNSSRSHAHKIQAAVAMEQRAREMGKTSEAAVYRKYINSMKKKTKKMNEEIITEKRDGKSAKDKGYSLRDWFKGGGWKQTGGKYDGKPCAKQPGQKTKPFCRDADDRAAMSKDERNRRAAKKRREDPNPDRKGKAKMVTDSYDFSNWRDEFKALEFETVDIIGTEPLKPTEGLGSKMLGEKCWKGYEKKGMKTMFGKRYPNCVKKEEVEVVDEMSRDKFDTMSGKPSSALSRGGETSAIQSRMNKARTAANAAGARGSEFVRPTKLQQTVNKAATMRNSYEPEGKQIDEFMGLFGPKTVTPKDSPSGTKSVTVGKKYPARQNGRAVDVTYNKSGNKSVTPMSRSRAGVMQYKYGSTWGMPQYNSYQPEGEQIDEKKGCSHTHEGKECPVHGKKECPDIVATKMDEGHKNPESVKGIAKELDKAVEMHKSQAKRLRKAGVSEGNAGPSTPVKQYDGKFMPNPGAGRPGKVRLKPGTPAALKLAHKEYSDWRTELFEGDGDHEYEMARRQLATIKNAVSRLEKKMGETGEGELKAWVQSKLTRSADDIDTVADYMTNEENIQEGEKDACYHKVKSRYSVWPSAYASGALVKCRKVGAKNWGNKTKKEEIQYLNTEDYQRIQEYGNVYTIIVLWRGKSHRLQLFFQGTARPSRDEVKNEVEKIYPGGMVSYYFPSPSNPGQPIIVSTRN